MFPDCECRVVIPYSVAACQKRKSGVSTERGRCRPRSPASSPLCDIECVRIDTDRAEAMACHPIGLRRRRRNELLDHLTAKARPWQTNLANVVRSRSSKTKNVGDVSSCHVEVMTSGRRRR